MRRDALFSLSGFYGFLLQTNALLHREAADAAVAASAPVMRDGDNSAGGARNLRVHRYTDTSGPLGPYIASCSAARPVGADTWPPPAAPPDLPRIPAMRIFTPRRHVVVQ